MGSASLKSHHLNDVGRLYDGPERNDEFVVTRHFVAVVSDKPKKESYLVEDVLIVKIVRRFKTRDEAWEFAYDLAGWARAEQSEAGPINSNMT